MKQAEAALLAAAQNDEKRITLEEHTLEKRLKFEERRILQDERNIEIIKNMQNLYAKLLNK